jgi:hemolysin activation/secretion protein
LLSDDLPGVAITGTMQAGPVEGETELLLKASDEPAYFGDATIDNTGSRFTGSQRVMLNLNFNIPTGQAELLNLALMHTQGTDYVRTGLTFPVGHNGWRLGANLSRVTYKVVSGLTEGSTPLRGKSDSLGLEAVYPWLRTREANIYLNTGLDVKTFFNEDTQVQSDYRSQAWRLGASANLFDAWGGGGANSASLQLLGGRLSHLREDTPQSKLSRHYPKLSYALTRQQALNAEHSLLLSLNGQHTTEPLDSSERFYLGGASSVRAYPSSEAGGDRGQALTAEWRWKLDPDWVLTTFVDQARVVTLPQTPSDTAASLTLKGYGLSVAWNGPKGINTRLTWSRRLGQNPKPMDNGNDHDGTLRKNRLWLSAGMAF